MHNRLVPDYQSLHKLNAGNCPAATGTPMRNWRMSLHMKGERPLCRVRGDYNAYKRSLIGVLREGRLFFLRQQWQGHKKGGPLPFTAFYPHPAMMQRDNFA